MGITAKFRSEHQPSELSCDRGLDYKRPDANFAPETAKARRPNRLGYTTALASMSKALETGADKLLGVDHSVFDDMLDAGVVCRGTSRLHMPPVAHAGNHLGDDWPGSLATQSLGNDQAETGFLGQLLRRKSTGESKMSEGGGHVWKRVSRILHSGRRSSKDTCDQKNSTAPVPDGPLERSHAANGPRNPSRGWKRFSRILVNVTVSSRRRSDGDPAQFTESVDPLVGDSGFLNSGSTRRHGLDIPSDGAEHVGERWYGSSSPGTTTRAYINEKHAATQLDKSTDTGKRTGTSRNWYRNLIGADVMKFFDQEPRRHSFGPAMRSSKRRWGRSAEGPGSLWSTKDERIGNRLQTQAPHRY